jgi:hypothetical protein
MRVRMPARKVARRAGVAGKLHGWEHRVIADNAVEAIETRGRETVEPPERTGGDGRRNKRSHFRALWASRSTSTSIWLQRGREP